MSKWFGKLGFVETKETELSVHSEIVTERDCYGDLTRNTRRLQSGDKVNDDISLANTLSIIADPYIQEHFCFLRYVTLYGGTPYRGKHRHGTCGCRPHPILLLP